MGKADVASITLKNVPEPLLDRLRRSAERSHRSLNRHIIACLEQQVMPRRIDVDQLVRRARALRSRGPKSIGTAELRALRNAGRE